ncbi:YIP1 family protein [Donghicola sp.]|jgi:hypothetical protein|uniref:YIP1 family protein n=1 Tax=Donghicola sp. TaxID=1929294 RepID=UPI0025E47EF9|nr:YIP1 family protein [Donghicola sp.]MCT4577395.1 YIP1 family protein [Donghicola sp.]
MSITRDMVATYRNPGQVFTRLSAMGQREDRALFWLIAACGLTFVGQWPKISREAFLNGQDFTESLTGPLMAWVFFAPLLFYILAGLLHLVVRIVGGKGKSYGARLALFWGFFASVPLLLLYGLTEGLAPGSGVAIVGALWLVAFVWFLFTGLKVAYWTGPLASASRGA